ncbi:FAD-binding protein, partial [Immundisolibacter sp.]
YRLPGQHNEFPDATLHPLADTGPYHAIILCAGVLDTKGGPVIDTHSRVLDGYGEPIAGLYGAGNCIAAPAGQAYWSAGATIGAALVFGALAGQHAATRRGR